MSGQLPSRIHLLRVVVVTRIYYVRYIHGRRGKYRLRRKLNVFIWRRYNTRRYIYIHTRVVLEFRVLETVDAKITPSK